MADGKVYSDDDDPNKPCLKCTLKHMMNAKTYLMEAIQFGFKTDLTIEELNAIMLSLCNYIMEKK